MIVLCFGTFTLCSSPFMLTRITFSRVPIIGGKELDLHHLFVEVTSRGGLEKVERIFS